MALAREGAALLLRPLLLTGGGRGCSGGPFFDNQVLRLEGGVAFKGLAVHGNLEAGAAPGTALVPRIEQRPAVMTAAAFGALSTGYTHNALIISGLCE